MATPTIRPRSWDTRFIAEAGISIALAGALHMVKVWQMPQGGSITLGTMVPLFILALRRGPLAVCVAGAVYGILEGWILSGGKNFYYPAQVLLDYPIAFGLLGLAGFFPKTPAFGILVCALARYAAHVVSGILFFAQYAKGPVVAYSLGYNALYLLPDFVIAIVLTLLVWERLRRLEPAR